MKLQSLPILLAVVLLATGCVYDSFEAPPGLDEEEMEPVSFSQDVLPILTANCQGNGCHSAGGHAPELTEANAYDSLINGGYVDVDDPENSEIYEWMSSRSMPMPPLAAGGRLSDDKVQIVLWWIAQGAEND